MLKRDLIVHLCFWISLLGSIAIFFCYICIENDLSQYNPSSWDCIVVYGASGSTSATELTKFLCSMHTILHNFHGNIVRCATTAVIFHAILTSYIPAKYTEHQCLRAEMWIHNGARMNVKLIFLLIMTSCHGNAFRVTDFLGIHRSPMDSPHKGHGVLFLVTVNVLFEKQSSCRWFMTLWCHCNSRGVG